jgi:CMP-N,N'-diacetyllegionaminic acid synthase
MSQIIALIPARGGSKGIPQKNLAMVAGRPLVAHTIEAAMQAASISTTYLSSDDEEILEIGRRAGCQTIKRPVELAGDNSQATDVVSHFISAALIGADDEAAIIYLQPTSPMRTARHIDEAVALMKGSRSKTVVSVTELEKSPYKSFVLDERGELQSLFEESLSNANRQSLPRTFIPNGAIYGFSLGSFRKRRAFPSNGSLPYIMDRQASLDIDTPNDLAIVRALMEQKNA